MRRSRKKRKKRRRDLEVKEKQSGMKEAQYLVDKHPAIKMKCNAENTNENVETGYRSQIK